MKLHPRTLLVQRAHIAFADALLKVIREHDLTPAETLSILTQELQSNVKFVLLVERHGTAADKKADEA